MAEAKTGEGALWGARFSSGPSPELARLSRSTHFDWQLAAYDIAGSHAHAKALAAAGYLSASEETAMHAGLDEQAEEGFAFATLLEDGKASGVPFSVAGGINSSTIASVQESGAQVAVAGGAIYGAPDVGAAAAELRAAIV